MLSRKVMSGGAPVDPYFKNVTLLLHGDGTNGGQNNTFIDGSSNNFTITRNGNTTQGSFNPYGTLWSNYFDGSGDYLQWTGTALGSGDFTVECFVNLQVLSANKAVIGSAAANTSAGWEIFTATDKFYFYSNGSSTITTTQVLTIGRWYHVAAVRSGSTLTLYIDGVNSGSATFTANLTNTTMYVSNDFAGQVHNAYVSNVRHVVGTAVYTANFTPPTSNLTAISGTSVLTCQSNRFIDNSTNNFAITRNGDVRVTSFAPFAPTSVYTTGLGASGYFDGTGDYLSVSASANQDFGSSAFTVDLWWYPTANTRQWFYHASTDYWFGIDYKSSGSVMGLWASSNGSSWNLINADPGGNGISTGTPAMNAWNHVAVGRSSGTWSMWLNGTRVLNLTGITSAIVSRSAQAKIIGGWAAGGQYIVNGYMSNFRVVIGADVYGVSNSTITVPTAPLTAITNTSLLCNFENAAIFDSAAKNDLETVGNAQIDTTTKKFGTGSLEFDGTGDWLLLPDNPDLQLGTGNLTVEFWVYLATGDTGSNRGLVSKGTASTGWSVSLNTTQKVVFSYASSTITSSGAITLDAWNHIAVVREGTGSNQTKIYINGTNDGTGTVSTDFNQTNVMYIGANRAAGDPMKGFIDDLRITKGVARYTANFTPPTRPFPDR